MNQKELQAQLSQLQRGDKHRSHAFNRVAGALVKYFEASQIASPLERQVAIAALPPYKSRGKGRSVISPRYGSKPGKYVPHQGVNECLRRSLRESFPSLSVTQRLPYVNEIFAALQTVVDEEQAA